MITPMDLRIDRKYQTWGMGFGHFHVIFGAMPRRGLRQRYLSNSAA